MTESYSYPCGKCEEEVEEEDQAVFCEGACQNWYHCKCIGLNDEQYKELYENEYLWECLQCNNNEFPSFNSVDAIDVFHFDFQQNLPTPKLTVGQQFYLRLLWTFLFGIYSASNKIMMAYMWHELMGKKGPNDVMSCLSHFIFKTALGRTGAKHSIWWADNCPGQNKNNYLMWFFQDLIRRKIYTRIDFKFLVPGHTYGPSDRYFALIEKYTSKVETVYVPQQWFDHVREAVVCTPTRIDVTEMQQSYFQDFRTHFRKIYTERTKDINGQSINFSDAVWFNFGVGETLINGQLTEINHSDVVWVRHSYDFKEKPQCVSYLKKRKKTVEVANIDTSPPLLYNSYPLPIKEGKATDLTKLVASYVPRQYQLFYSKLPTEDGSDNEDDM